MLIFFSYFQLFLFSFLAATILPFSSEIILSGMYLTGSFFTINLLLVASLGNIFGSIANWYLGKKISTYKDKKWFPVSTQQLQKSEFFFNKYGYWSLLLAWVPIIGDPITLLAGVLKVRISIFILFVSISKISRYIFILYLSSYLV